MLEKIQPETDRLRLILGYRFKITLQLMEALYCKFPQREYCNVEKRA